jgi:polysaccharide pyruvyl transferase WcaK-like protein
LIVNAVPLNNGDAALVFALYDAMKKKGLDVAIAAHCYGLIREIYPEVNIVRDVLDYPIIKKSRFFKRLLIPFFLLFLKHYREADTIVGAPGGYLNSNYGVFDKLYVFSICKILRKKTAIYSQSVGPLNNKDAIVFSFFMKYIDILYVRDQMSYDAAISYSKNDTKIRLTEDAAFLSKPVFCHFNKNKKIAVSVRDWDFDNRNRIQYYSLIAELVKNCVQMGYSVEFISTCQGIPGYVDDSLVAKKIVSEHLKGIERITIRYNSYTLGELRTILNEYDFVIGTRLHMCILSMLKGIPAFNISYEAKGKECFSYLGISLSSVDYNEQIDTALASLKQFIVNLDEHERYIKDRIAVSYSNAVRNFDEFCLEMR